MPAEIFYSATVDARWLDALDHVNFLEYQRAADKATDAFWVAVGGEMAETGRSSLSIVIVETHARYLRELRLGDPVEIGIAVRAFDRRRVHLEHTVRSRGEVSCVIQVLGLAFDLVERAASHWPDAMRRCFAERCDRPESDRVGPLIPA